MKLEQIEVILKNYERMSFEDLLKLRFNFGKLPDDLYDHYWRHELRGLDRGEEGLQKIEFMLESLGKSLVRKENCLELGCGMGGVTDVNYFFTPTTIKNAVFTPYMVFNY